MFESHISISFFRARSLCAENQSCWCKSSRKELMKHFSMEKSTYMCALHARSVSRPLMLFFNGISLSIIHYYCQVLSSMRCCFFFCWGNFFFPLIVYIQNSIRLLFAHSFTNTIRSRKRYIKYFIIFQWITHTHTHR